MDRRLSARRWRTQRRRRARRITALIIVILVLGFAWWFIERHRRHVQPVAVPAPAAANLPQLLVTRWLRAGEPWTARQRAGLHAALAALASNAAFPQASGILVLDARDGSVLYSLNSRMALVPGSTMKLLTAAAAFGTLGPQYRFITKMVTDGAVNGAQLNGNLWLVGGGDPDLTSDDLRRGIRALALHGVGEISGSVDVDGSRYGPDKVAPSWMPDDLQYGWAAPPTALSLNGDSVQFTITPQAGGDATVAVDPPGERVISSVQTAPSDADNTLTVDALPGGSGYDVRGQIPFGAPQKYWRALPHPTQAIAATFVAMLRQAGMGVNGSGGVDAAPAQQSVLWEHRSRTLDRIVRHMFFLSDNHYAEQLLREVGWKADGLGTPANSLQAERDFLQTIGVSPHEVVLADGSGLSADNRASAGALAAALRYIIEQPMPEPAYTLLPRAGMEGTVVVRQLAPSALGRVYAKDGYIEGASSIAGYVLTAHHGPVIFAFIVNDWQNGLDAVWAQEDQMLDTLARM